MRWIKKHATKVAARQPLRIEQLESRCLLTYMIVDLGHLGGGGTLAWSINNKGEVVGESNTAQGDVHAFIYRDHKITDLGTLGGDNSVAYAINNNSQVTGRAFLPGDQEEHAYLWDSANGMQEIETLGGESGAGTAINDAGQVVGQSDLITNTYHAFTYPPITDLGPLGSGDKSAARGINEHGHITGGSFTGTGEQHAFVWRDNVMTDLGTLGGPISKAYGINDSTVIVGTSHLGAEGPTHAYRWDDNATPKMNDLGTFGGDNSVARAINVAGTIVGDAQTTNGESRAFLYQNDTMIDLNTLIPAQSGWFLEGAYGINDKGQIIGWGTRHGEQGHSFLLSRKINRAVLPPPGGGIPITPPPRPGDPLQPSVGGLENPPVSLTDNSQPNDSSDTPPEPLYRMTTRRDDVNDQSQPFVIRTFDIFI